MFDRDGPIGRGECLPDISMYAALIHIQTRLEYWYSKGMPPLKSTRQ
jgi:hypothetical protein